MVGGGLNPYRFHVDTPFQFDSKLLNQLWGKFSDKLYIHLLVPSSTACHLFSFKNIFCNSEAFAVLPDHELLLFMFLFIPELVLAVPFLCPFSQDAGKERSKLAIKVGSNKEEALQSSSQSGFYPYCFPILDVRYINKVIYNHR